MMGLTHKPDTQYKTNNTLEVSAGVFGEQPDKRRKCVNQIRQHLFHIKVNTITPTAKTLSGAKRAVGSLN